AAFVHSNRASGCDVVNAAQPADLMLEFKPARQCLRSACRGDIARQAGGGGNCRQADATLKYVTPSCKKVTALPARLQYNRLAMVVSSCECGHASGRRGGGDTHED